MKTTCRKKKIYTSKYTTKKDALILTLRILIILSISTTSLYFGFKNDINPALISNLGFLFVLCNVLSILAKKGMNIRILSMILVIYIHFILLPVFLLYGAETKSSTPVWYAAAVIIAIYLLDIKEVWWVLILSFYVGTLLYVRNFVWNAENALVYNRNYFFIGFAASFVPVAIAVTYVLIRMEKNFSFAENEIDKSHEIEMNAGMAKSRFLANMSHEIRTPMNSIIGLSELVLKDEMDDSTRNEVCIIRQSAYDLLEIIDDVLMYAKLDSGKVKLLCVDFGFDDLLKSAISTVSSNLKDKDVKIRVKVDHNIPKVINGDDIRIKQILMRLIFISLSLTENGRLMLEFKCERDDANGKVKIISVISDTGCGLSDVDLDAICGVYDKYDSRQNSNLKGIGLKYNICRELLALMNGDLQIRSIEGMGLESVVSFECDIVNPEPMISVENSFALKILIYVTDNRELNAWKSIMEGFRIRPDYVNSYFAFDKAMQNTEYDFVFVPSGLYASVQNVIELYKNYDNTYVVCGNANSYGDFSKCRIIRHPVSSLIIADVLGNLWKAEDYISKAENIEYDGSKAKILVVDDSSVNLKVAAGIFRSFKIEIETAKSGEEALKLLEQKEYDLVFLDMVMPEMSGTETLKKMRASSKKSTADVPVIALTANTGGNIREEVLADGYQEYIAKPIKVRYLTQALLQFLPPGTMKRVLSSSDSHASESPVGMTAITGKVKENQPKTVDKEIELKCNELIKKLKPAVSDMNLNECDKIIDELHSLKPGGGLEIKLDDLYVSYSLYDFKHINEIMMTI